MFSAKEETIHSIFQENRYSVPYYQRPYSWQSDNVENLWDDLFAAWSEHDNSDEGYFLGSVVLVEKPENDRSDVVDGQQRFTSLQLLIRAIAESISSEKKRKALLKYVISEEDEFAGTKAELALEPGQRFHSVFRKIMEGLEIEGSETKIAGRYLENYQTFRKKAEQLNEDDLIEFGKFVVQKAHLAVLRANSEVKALRIFSVLNDRGIDLHPVDILKARLLEQTEGNEQRNRKYADRWEELEEEFGRDRFQDLISHIRMIFVRGRTKVPLHEDMQKRIKSKQQTADFLNSGLQEYASAFSYLQNTDDVFAQDLSEIGKRSRFKDWEAPAIFAVKNRDKIPSFKSVIKRLSSIIAMMAVTKMPDGQRAGRFGRIISDIDDLIAKKKKLDDLENLKISKAEFSSFCNALQENAYSLRGLKAAMLWLETIHGDGERPVTSGEVTLEHVLPRLPGEEQEWLNRFDKDTWAQASNRVGNLVLLSGRSNRQMARKSFNEKKAYMKKKGGASWVWTNDIFSRNDWTLEEVKARETRIFRAAKKGFSF